MSKSMLYRSRVRRLSLSALATGVIMIPIIAALFAKVQLGDQTESLKKIFEIANSDLVVIAALIAFLILILKWYFTYRKLTYDPTWVLKYQAMFDEMKDERDLAARTLLKYKGKLGEIKKYRKQLEGIDDILDFLGDVGFYMIGDQISPEVAHNHFYHWVRGYWIASREYVNAWREGEPKRWDSIEVLFDTLCTIEVGVKKKAWEKEILLAANETEDFLKSELKEKQK